MTVTIDGKTCQCEKGEFLLQIAKRNGIGIPTLCHYESMPGQGCCRLCIVEVLERGRSRIVVSCVYPVESPCEVFTDSEKVRRQRGIILALLRARAPESEVIASLCEKYGAPDMPGILPLDSGKCILCGLCARACTELSVGAISTVNRGVTKEVAPPYHEPSAVCIGCGSCARICPTNAIEIIETQNARTIWGKTFSLVTCEKCGRVIGTREELDYAARLSGGEPDFLCEDCRKRAIADELAHAYGRL